MAFKMSTQKVTGTVNVVEIGTGDKAIKLGGEQVLPFYNRKCTSCWSRNIRYTTCRMDRLLL